MSRLSKTALLLPLIGLLCGFLNGLLGAGGGIAIVYGLRYLLRNSELSPRDIYANALCAMLPVSAASCLFYTLQGNLSFDGFSLFLIPAILGGLLGGLLLDKIQTPHLQKLFAVLVVASGMLLLIR